MKLEMDFDTFFEDNFVVNIAALLGISVNRIKVAEVRRGSVIISLTIDPAVLDVGTSSESQAVLQDQVDELALLGENITQMTVDGSLAEGLNTTITSFTLIETVVTSDEPSENIVGDQNATNTTDEHGTVIPLITAAPTQSPDPSMEPTAPPFICVVGDREKCSNRGVCGTDFEGGSVCICDDQYHYWPSELCSVYHEGGELEDGNCCIPNVRDYYCSWQGTCDPTGQFCVCTDPLHHFPEDRCSEWHQSPPPQPGQVCFPESVDDYCHWRGRCNAQGTACECFDSGHYLASDQCEHWYSTTSGVTKGSIIRTEAEATAATNAAADHCPGFPSVPSFMPTGAPTRVPTPAPSPATGTVTTAVPTPAAPAPSPLECDRAYCNNRGLCTLLSDGTASCSCYDFYHYWSSDQCSQRHDGRELQPGQVCYPNTKDQYCSWLGTCNSEGSACICDEAEHRIPEEQCRVWHHSVPSAAPVPSPSLPPDTPTATPHASPTKAPSTAVVVCNAGDRSYCNNRGRCSSTGTECVCDDVYHYWSAELCSTYHWGRELETGQVCFPGAADYYCNYLGVCSADGQTCECFDPEHRSPADKCKTWMDNVDGSAPTPAPVPLPDGAVCVPGANDYCNDNGYCLIGGDGCACWDELHYWPSELCASYHHGPQLQEEGDCCVPGEVDFYCSWMGECAADGESCLCFDPEHFWPSDRCQQYHEGPDPLTPEPDTCPALLSIPDENTEQRNNNQGTFLTRTMWQYALLAAIGAFLILAAFGGYRYFKARDLSNGNNSSMYSHDPLHSFNGRVKSGIEMSFNNALPLNTVGSASDVQLSVMENQGDGDDDDHLEEVNLCDMSGIYKQQPNANNNSYTTVSFKVKKKPPVLNVRDDSFSAIPLEEEGGGNSSPPRALAGGVGRPTSSQRGRSNSAKVPYMSLNTPPTTPKREQGGERELGRDLDQDQPLATGTGAGTGMVVVGMRAGPDEFHMNTDESQI